jgi:hypothetical protein
MNNANSNDGGLYVLGVLFVFYVFAGVGVLFVVTHGFKRPGEDELWKRLLSLPFLPAFVVWFILMAVFSIPYWWLYPEKHRTVIDFEGSEEEKQKLREYRNFLSKKGVFRRLAEKLGFMQKNDPPWPFPPQA